MQLNLQVTGGDLSENVFDIVPLAQALQDDLRISFRSGFQCVQKLLNCSLGSFELSVPCFQVTVSAF